MDKLRLVTYCGLYCGLCAQRGRIPLQAKALRDSMAKEGYESWAGQMPGFSEFWGFLAGLRDRDRACPGCRQGGGPPGCPIRKCATGRKIDVCVYCGEYPCGLIRALATGYPTLVADGRRLQAIGVDAWVAEQQQRQAAGFQYADVRYEPYNAPPAD